MHLVDNAVTQIQHASLPQRFWDYAVMIAAFLYNENPSKVLGGKSPFEVLFGNSPDYSKLKVFGCKSFPCLRAYQQSKLDPKKPRFIIKNHDSLNVIQ